MKLRVRECIIAALLAGLPGAAAAADVVSVTDVDGVAEVKQPSTDRFIRARIGDRIGRGSRIRTGLAGKVTLQFPDGTRTQIMPKSEVVVRLAGRGRSSTNGVLLFFGRLWTEVVKSVSGRTAFEVRSANAVAGVRGTRFDVGVADDGAVRVVVGEGRVDVRGDVGDRAVQVARGQQVESDARGRLQKRRKAPKRVDWDGWFARRARALEQRGRAVAEDLYGRLDRRRSKLERLVGQQKALREQIEALEAERKKGADVKTELQVKLRQLQRVTERLEDMRNRLQAAFGIFEMWGRLAASKSTADSRQIRLLVEDAKRVEKGFLDLFEEGTDQSVEGLEEMMQDMEKGPTLRPRKRLKDELF